ncbi:dTDP-4-amino-4,6-dideoxygalactose transaminase [Geofilum rubicundum]|uniref:4-keto-6-deoxy-N-Acetyl-D-hexosaminyl-aminotransferase n=1 Tax=Geofilum rubicundum JCM 15548 TaxID=1236989 RepID=A0A0E9LY00_9BACT|nr:dTDP-4-amino-4,6-dideoxygalactose transaminase [Geofilum rubicundum]GAO30437.1 4-keto-6-deoxy-N-Acetyl-D-hexosaminyl-aminotransferase [Geofilum rubicundum JCM 15548]
MIPFNKPHITGKEVHHIYGAVATGHISGNGKYTKLCQNYFEERWGFKKTLLTTSCTDALEMCALLVDIQPGDEVILPSYTFVSTALAFVRQGAVLRFVDSRKDHPGMDEEQIEALITPKTKAIVPVHYAGVACDMDKIMQLADKYNLFVIEDAAQAIDSYFKSPKEPPQKPRALGSIGHLGCFSFHETKNIQCGEGGLLAINDPRFIKRAEILWEKGTNRAEFFRGEVNKYGWVDTGSSFLPGEITAAFLWAQLEELDRIQNQRKAIWNQYQASLQTWAAKTGVLLPYTPDYATPNAHMFYLVCPSPKFRTQLIEHLKKHNIHAVFHYLSLHNSPYYKPKYTGNQLPKSDYYSDCLVRLPLYYDLAEVEDICETINNFNQG